MPLRPPVPDPAFVFELPDADTRAIARKQLDLAYAGESPFQRLDLYLPDQGDGPFPLILHVHGGAWMKCDKADRQLVPMLSGLRRSWAVGSMNYRLSHEALFPAQLRDVRSALRWLRAHGRELHIDGERIALWGGSAGAHLSSLAALTAGVTSFDAPGEAGRLDVQAVVAWYGPTDFLAMDRYLAESGLGPRDHGQPDSPESRLLGAPIAEVPELVQRANPETWVTAAAPPFLLQHGLSDSTVPFQHSVSLAEALRRAIGPERVFLDLIPGVVHADRAFETEENLGRVFAFLEANVR
jgi:acetyl esterase/lipase